MTSRLRSGSLIWLALALVACTPTPGGPATVTATTTVTTTVTAAPTAPATMSVIVYFGNQVLNPGAADCGQVYGVPREVPASNDALSAAMNELLAGPTPAETTQGYTSWFSAATAQALVSAEVSGSTSYVNLTDLRAVIPNASTSCGSAGLLAQLTTTAQQAGMTPNVRYAINGAPQPFWDWLQIGCSQANDFCDPTPFS